MPENKKKKEFFDAELQCKLLKEQAITHGWNIDYLLHELWGLQDTVWGMKWLLGITMVALLGTIMAMM